jgi:AAA family ATP:ADP antiporter
LWAVVVLAGLGRGRELAVAKPARELLYTVVDREDKYKAKNFIDTFVYRAGDQLAAWSYTGMIAAGLSMAALSFVMVPIAGLWLGLAVWLGRRQVAMAERRPAGVAGTLATEAT